MNDNRARDEVSRNRSKFRSFFPRDFVRKDRGAAPFGKKDNRDTKTREKETLSIRKVCRRAKQTTEIF